MHTTKLTVLTGRKMFGSDARAQTAKLGNGAQGSIRQLMNYQEKDGRVITKTEFPAVHFMHHKEGFCLLGFGELGHELVHNNAAALSKLWSEALGMFVPIRIETQKLAAVPSSGFHRYRIPKMCVQKRQFHNEWLQQPETGLAHLEGLFERSLRRQAAAVGIELPEKINVAYAGADRTLAINIGSGKPHQAALSNALFDVDLQLDGYWTAGYHLSKGYGQFFCKETYRSS